MLTRLALVSFGERDEWYAQAHLAILTALANLPAPHEVVVTTDRPDCYRWLSGRILLRKLTPEDLVEWSGPQRFVWRIVLKALVEAALREPQAHFIYLDTDTLVRKPLDSLVAALEAGDVFLHTLESPLHARRADSHRNLWEQTRGRFSVDDKTELWNSGVVALGAQNLQLLPKALRLCDEMTAAGVESWLIEQLAQSIVYQSTGRLRAAKPFIDHYWGNKAGYNESVRKRLATVLMRGMSVEQAVEYVREHPIPQRPLRVKPRWWHRYFKRLAGAEH
ncbi:MAG: hypothetical protein E6J78_16135 [Deltaproteobacteria bacterium]|nr:MAG: hypothetical protein E6J78_16135 [Deltaproteobacteria bacterium]